MYLVVTPAYGQDYKSALEIITAWESGKDFYCCSVGMHRGKYLSIRDVHQMKEDGFIGIQFRYYKLTRTAVIEWGSHGQSNVGRKTHH